MQWVAARNVPRAVFSDAETITEILIDDPCSHFKNAVTIPSVDSIFRLVRARS